MCVLAFGRQCQQWSWMLRRAEIKFETVPTLDFDAEEG